MRHVAKWLYVVHRFIQAGLELFGEILAILLTEDDTIGDGEERREEFAEALLQRFPRQRLLEIVRGVGGRHVVHQRLVERQDQGPAHHRQRAVHLVERAQRLVLRLSQQDNHRVCKDTLSLIIDATLEKRSAFSISISRDPCNPEKTFTTFPRIDL